MHRLSIQNGFRHQNALNIVTASGSFQTILAMRLFPPILCVLKTVRCGMTYVCKGYIRGGHDCQIISGCPIPEMNCNGKKYCWPSSPPSAINSLVGVLIRQMHRSGIGVSVPGIRRSVFHPLGLL